MPFGVATVYTNNGKRTAADRLQTTPTRNPFKFLGIGTGATGAARTAAATDTALSTEYTTAAGGQPGRTSGTESNQTTTVTGDTYQVVASVTAAGASAAVDEAMLFDASTGGNPGISATHNVVNLAIGDSLQYTIKLQFS